MISSADKMAAIQSLVPGAQVTIEDGRVTWYDPAVAPVTEEQIAAEVERLRYVPLRAQAYPNPLDQLDMLWHAMDQGKLSKDNDFYQAIKAVKDRFPKA